MCFEIPAIPEWKWNEQARCKEWADGQADGHLEHYRPEKDYQVCCKNGLFILWEHRDKFSAL
jgi:hypothetical protein